jgi:hypothetical protein
MPMRDSSVAAAHAHAVLLLMLMHADRGAIHSDTDRAHAMHAAVCCSCSCGSRCYPCGSNIVTACCVAGLGARIRNVKPWIRTRFAIPRGAIPRGYFSRGLYTVGTIPAGCVWHRGVLIPPGVCQEGKPCSVHDDIRAA